MRRASEIRELDGWPNPPMLHIANVKKAIRMAWKRAYGSTCQSCGGHMHFDAKFRNSNKYATIDHILARALGGDDTLENVQVICKECNNKKSSVEYLQQFFIDS